MISAGSLNALESRARQTADDTARVMEAKERCDELLDEAAAISEQARHDYDGALAEYLKGKGKGLQGKGNIDNATTVDALASEVVRGTTTEI